MGFFGVCILDSLALSAKRAAFFSRGATPKPLSWAPVKQNCATTYAKIVLHLPELIRLW